MGRRAMPTALKILRGNPGQRRLPAHEPKPDPLPAAAPEELQRDPVAAAEWERLIGGLTRTGHVTVTDRALLIAYCLKYSRWLTLEALAARDDTAITSRDKDERIMAAKALAAADRACEVFIRAAGELGLTPTSRTRVSAKPPAPAVSKWKGVLP